jgi:hypothetical protein
MTATRLQCNNGWVRCCRHIFVYLGGNLAKISMDPRSEPIRIRRWWLFLLQHSGGDLSLEHRDRKDIHWDGGDSSDLDIPASNAQAHFQVCAPSTRWKFGHDFELSGIRIHASWANSLFYIDLYTGRAAGRVLGQLAEKQSWKLRCITLSRKLELVSLMSWIPPCISPCGSRMELHVLPLVPNTGRKVIGMGHGKEISLFSDILANCNLPSISMPILLYQVQVSLQTAFWFILIFI